MREQELPRDEGVGSDRVRSAALHQLPWYVIVMAGPDHRVVAVNDAAIGVFGGFNPTGLRAVDFMLGVEGQGVLAIYDRAYAGETVELHRMRNVVMTPQGHQHELLIDFVMSPLRDRHGDVVGVTGIGRDVTAQVRQQEAQAAAADELGRRYRRATDVVDEVQRALLPTRLPVLPAVDLAASYAVGGAEQAAGGDWFDVLPVAGGRVAAVVGDVVGHGVDASAAMAQLRAVALERLHAGADVTEVVTALDRFVEVAPAGRGATVCVLALDVRTGDLRWCSAGHPPPLVAGGDGGFLPPSGQGPLGETVTRQATSGRLGVGQVLLLYTDGIVERPGVPATRGVVELGQVTAAAVADELLPAFSASSAVDRATAQVLERLTRETGATDDVTLLALQRLSPLAPLRLEREVALRDVGEVRASLRAWFRPGQVDEHALSELDQVVTELVENAVEHAYGGTGGPVVVEAELTADGVLVLRVRDRGPWRPPSSAARGRGIGLALVQQLSTSVAVAHDTGTEVTVRLRPWKRSHGTVPRHPDVDPAVADVYVQETGDLNVLHVAGPVDAALVDELTTQLALCTKPGAPELVVDLDRVTMLSSRAISAVRESLRRAEDAGVPTTVRCRPGTVAQQVLALAAVPTAPDDERSPSA